MSGAKSAIAARAKKQGSLDSNSEIGYALKVLDMARLIRNGLYPLSVCLAGPGV